MSTFSRSRLVDVRKPLLALHRALIEAALLDHEREHGRVEGSNRVELLQSHPSFAWLRPISQLVLRIDEALEEEGAPLDPLLAETAALLAPAERDDELGRRYVAVLQEHPDAVLAHAVLRHAVERGFN
jgi:hypothetical protein